MNKKVLVVYYSLQGSARRVGDMISKVTNGDTFEIELVKPYTMITAGLLGSVQGRINKTVEIKNKLDNIEDYDTIFIGAPIWCYTLIPPILSFIKEYNLEGKIVVPFCTHAGNYGDYYEKFKANCSATKVVEGSDFFKVKKMNDTELKEQVEKFVKKVL